MLMLHFPVSAILDAMTKYGCHCPNQTRASWFLVVPKPDHADK